MLNEGTYCAHVRFWSRFEPNVGFRASAGDDVPLKYNTVTVSSRMRYSTLALKLEDAFREKARENISAAVTRSNIERNSLNPSLANLPKLDLDSGFNTRAEVAKIADVSERTIGYVKVIQKEASSEQIDRGASLLTKGDAGAVAMPA